MVESKNEFERRKKTYIGIGYRNEGKQKENLSEMKRIKYHGQEDNR
jgi:hypothetical protein